MNGLNHCLGNCLYYLLYSLGFCCGLRRCLCTLDGGRLPGLLPNRLLPQYLAGCGLPRESSSFHSSRLGFRDSFSSAFIRFRCSCLPVEFLDYLGTGFRTRYSTSFSMSHLWDCSLITGNGRRFPLCRFCRMNWSVVFRCRLRCIV